MKNWRKIILFLKKEGLYKSFVVLILRVRKIAKTNSFNRWW